MPVSYTHLTRKNQKHPSDRGTRRVLFAFAGGSLRQFVQSKACLLYTSLTAADEDVAHMLRRSHKPIILAVNKCDKVGDAPMEMYEFYNLGFDEDVYKRQPRGSRKPPAGAARQGCWLRRGGAPGRGPGG